MNGRGYRCIDGYCGAWDCLRCHPEGDPLDEPEDDDEWGGPYNEDDGFDEAARWR